MTNFSHQVGNVQECIAGIDVAPLWLRTLELNAKGDSIMLWTILVILLVLWLLGVIGHVGGGLIHLLLVVAAVILVINLLTGRRAV
jgi:K+-transporting ATPase A subunit